jgi:hypothetical protein
VLAFPGDDVPFCSAAFDKPARLVFNSGQMTLTIGNETTQFSPHEPLGGPTDDDLYGFVLVEGNDGSGINESATDVYAVKIGDVEAVIFRDRVFWPCAK